MRFIYGCFPRQLNNFSIPVPLDTSQVWENTPLYYSNHWTKEELQVFESPQLQAFIVGTNITTKEEQESIFMEYQETGNIAVFNRWKGNDQIFLYHNNSLLLIPDLLGLYPIYFIHLPEYTVFSSRQTILSCLFNKQVDMNQLLISLLCSSITEFKLRKSIFQNIQSIPPCQALLLTKSKNEYKMVWRDDSTMPLVEGAANFRNALLDTVQRRVEKKSHVSLDISGGLDSTPLAILASKNPHLMRSGITYQSESEHEWEDGAIAKEICETYGIDSTFVSTDEAPSPYEKLAQAPLTDEPIPFLHMYAKILYGLKIMKSKGSELHLTGDSGDNVLNANGHYIVDLLNLKSLNQFTQHLYARSRLRNHSPFKMLKEAVTLRFQDYPHWVKKQAKSILRPISTHPIISGWSGNIGRFSWISQEQKATIAKQLEEWAQKAIPYSKVRSIHSDLVHLHWNARLARSLSQLGDSINLRVQFPYLDTLIVRTCLHIRAEERANPYEFKPLMKRAFQKELPQSLLQRNTKGDYTFDLYKGVQKQFSQLKELLLDMELVQFGIIEKDTWMDICKRFEMGVSIPLWEFNLTLAYECWLRSIKKSDLLWEEVIFDENCIPCKLYRN
ncbi:asparagine synthase-related protein [Paenactinomyces guangxiensis]|uniref:asparagine synthase (glutamine-hydrolyzing) n=1 Tax=Paenactinomyces guangxiensis TaxID=1490290 RepID=A0A7W1WPH9_9BACL|nr:asparagine synthase [Paenactinomyces guangxiensis]MBA4493677.1 asparagine synthase [Paenactinomyces guangxiensis]MBH8590964.1 asparagine synthase [Paenactinomyces guangxiensis]